MYVHYILYLEIMTGGRCNSSNVSVANSNPGSINL